MMPCRLSHCRAKQRVSRGQSMTELALVLPLLALILLGVVDLGRAFFYSTRLSDAVKEGALYGIHYPANVTGTPDSITYHTTYESPVNLNLQPGDVTVRCYQGLSTTVLVNGTGDCTKAQVGDTVQVSATYQFRPFTQQIIRLLGSSLPMTRTARMVIVQTAQ